LQEQTAFRCSGVNFTNILQAAFWVGRFLLILLAHGIECRA
jgi:hypothetical protein